MTIKKFRGVKYSNPLELIFLLISTFIIFILLIKLFIWLISYRLISIGIALILSILYFLFIKKRIIKVSDFTIYLDRLEWENKKVEFNNIKSYKIHWIKGAGLKLKLKNGKTLKLSANNNFYNSDKFIQFCESLDKTLDNETIERKFSFYETKIGYYITITVAVIYIITVFYSFFEDKKFDVYEIGLTILIIGTIWYMNSIIKKYK